MHIAVCVSVECVCVVGQFWTTPWTGLSSVQIQSAKEKRICMDAATKRNTVNPFEIHILLPTITTTETG